MSIYGRSDSDLLVEFSAEGNSAAFEELVLRHGKLVTGTCRRVLGDADLAEDAAQAVFLTLAHKASALQGRASIAGWLHHVALNISLRARQAESRRKNHEREAGEMTRLKPDTNELRSAAMKVLDGELDALPENYRMALMLHHLEGNTVEQAAERMNCPTGTVAAWLSRGREMLRERLERKGAALSLGLLGALLDEEFARSELTEKCVRLTTRAAALAAAGHAAGESVSPQAAQMTQGALRSMLIEKLKLASVSAIALVLAGTCGFLAVRASESGSSPVPTQAIVSNSAASAVSVDPRARLAACVEALASATAAERIAAERELRTAGESARPVLASAAASPVPAVRARASRLISRLDAEPLLQRMDAAIAGIKTVDLDFASSHSGRQLSGHWTGNFQDLSRYRIQMNRNKTTDIGKMEWLIFDGATEWSSILDEDAPYLEKVSIQTTARTWVWPLISARFMENLRANYDATSIAESLWNNTPAVTLTFTRIETDAVQQLELYHDFFLTAQIQIQVPKDDMIPREWQFSDDQNAIVRSRSVSKLKVNPVLEDAAFKFVPSEDEDVLDLGIRTDEGLMAAPGEKNFHATPVPNPDDF